MTKDIHPFSDGLGSGNETIISTFVNEGAVAVKWYIRTFEDRPVFLSKVELTNKSNKDLSFASISPISFKNEQDGCIIHSDEPLHFLDINAETWRYKYIRRLEKQGESGMVTGIANSYGKGIALGFVTFNKHRGYFKFHDQRDANGVLNIDAYNIIEPHQICHPGEKMASEWVYINCVDDTFTGLETWASLTGSVNNAVFSDPKAAGFYTWYYYRETISEEIILENARFLAENRDRFPVNYIHIDWGWQRNFSSGDTVPNNKFPNGLKWIASEIRKLGFSPSIWINPFMQTVPTADGPAGNPNAFLKNSDGSLLGRKPIRNIMGESFGNMEYIVSEGVTRVVDPSIPEGQSFLKNRYKWAKSLGFDMIMMDFIEAPRINSDEDAIYGDQKMSTIEAIRKGLEAAREGLGPDIDILGCGTLYEPSVGISNLTRISIDAPAGWAFAKEACNDIIMQYFMNNKLWTNYADGLFLRNEPSPHWPEVITGKDGKRYSASLTDDEAEFYAAVTSLSGSAVMFTEDIKRLEPHRQWLLSMVLPVYDKGEFRPLDLFETEHPKLLQVRATGNGFLLVA